MDLETRLIEFEESLSDEKGTATWQTAQIFNALLDQTKQAHPDDPIVAVIQPAEQSAAPSHSTTTNGALRTASRQLIAAVRGS